MLVQIEAAPVDRSVGSGLVQKARLHALIAVPCSEGRYNMVRGSLWML